MVSPRPLLASSQSVVGHAHTPAGICRLDGRIHLEALAYLHALILAIDANFRMKNRIRPNEQQNTTLGPGLGFFVNPVPYKLHINRYTSERDFSTCIAFQALTAKDTKLTTGLRVSGVGGVSLRARGILTWTSSSFPPYHGSRSSAWYCHTTSLASGSNVFRSAPLTCSRRPRLTTDLSKFKLQFALPVWHAEAHEEKCRSANSLTHAVGVGRTDGESIERLWSLLNPISYSTKEMGAGNRHDTIEAKLDYINFQKNVTQGTYRERSCCFAELTIK
ncbi:CxC2 domain-containing protein [Mycena chlorophos]|uniref:CxC2 domain-containing protein n=1 Tax=Mycena chlorophos TaxID=658473 RepID=A0A8H6WHV3_MYCCL|nr:CxC2 domain-containing protein [Mycena chlorophos]